MRRYFTIFLGIFLPFNIQATEINSFLEEWPEQHFLQENIDRIAAETSFKLYHYLLHKKVQDQPFNQAHSSHWDRYYEVQIYNGRPTRQFFLIKKEDIPLSEALNNFLKDPIAFDEITMHKMIMLKILEGITGTFNFDQIAFWFEIWDRNSRIINMDVEFEKNPLLALTRDLKIYDPEKSPKDVDLAKIFTEKAIFEKALRPHKSASFQNKKLTYLYFSEKMIITLFFQEHPFKESVYRLADLYRFFKNV